MTGGRRRFDSVPTIPMDALVDMGPAVQPTEPAGTERTRGASAVAYGRCPLHVDPKPTALVWDGPHLTWREHTYRTWAGTPFTCGGSLQRVCEHPSKYMPGETTPTCPCATERTESWT